MEIQAEGYGAAAEAEGRPVPPASERTPLPVAQAVAEVMPATVEKLPIPEIAVETPDGPVNVTMYGGGYNPSTNQVGLGRFHNHGSELILPEGVDPKTIPGITVTDIPSKGKLFWNNNSASQSVKLTPDQVRAVQEGLRQSFPGREIIFDPNNSAMKEFHNQLKGIQ